MSRWIAATAASLALAIHPPSQPASGPGGAAYPYSETDSFEIGSGSGAAVVFTPVPVPMEPVPVLVFLHGWSAVQPASYQFWLNHLVRRGNYVIYPRYQANLRTLPPEMLEGASQGIKDSIAALQKRGAKIDLNRFAIATHSFGGVLAPILAASARERGLPEVKALFLTEPGGSKGIAKALPSSMKDFSAIPSKTLAVIVVGDKDVIVGDEAGRKIFSMLTSIPSAQKNLLLMRSDVHGTPGLLANHMAPLARRDPDALDFYGFWKLFDALTAAAFNGTNKSQALGGTPEQLSLGSWSDGTPVRPMQVLK